MGEEAPVGGSSAMLERMAKFDADTVKLWCIDITEPSNCPKCQAELNQNGKDYCEIFGALIDREAGCGRGRAVKCMACSNMTLMTTVAEYSSPHKLVIDGMLLDKRRPWKNLHVKYGRGTHNTGMSVEYKTTEFRNELTRRKAVQMDADGSAVAVVKQSEEELLKSFTKQTYRRFMSMLPLICPGCRVRFDKPSAFAYAALKITCLACGNISHVDVLHVIAIAPSWIEQIQVLVGKSESNESVVAKQICDYSATRFQLPARDGFVEISPITLDCDPETVVFSVSWQTTMEGRFLRKDEEQSASEPAAAALACVSASV